MPRLDNQHPVTINVEQRTHAKNDKP